MESVVVHGDCGVSDSDHCADCQRPTRTVRVYGWESGPKDGSIRIPLDYVKSPEGEYSVRGSDIAIFIKADARLTFQGPLYTDHRRTCPNRKLSEDRPQLVKVRIACGACQGAQSSWAERDDAKKTIERFIEEHTNCRGRKAS
jgi:hypothetical protein